jgi:hypothetical protein
VARAVEFLCKPSLENMGTAVITQEVAVEIDGLYCDFGDWIRSHPQGAADVIFGHEVRS